MSRLALTSTSAWTASLFPTALTLLWSRTGESSLAAANFCIHVEPNLAANLITTDLGQGGNAAALALAGSLLDPDKAGVTVSSATSTGSLLAIGSFTGGGLLVGEEGEHVAFGAACVGHQRAVTDALRRLCNEARLGVVQDHF